MNRPTPPDTPADTLTTREVAHQLGLAVRSVQLMVDRGDLQAWKTSGGHRRILAQSVKDWLARQPGPSHGGNTVRRRADDVSGPTVLLIEDSSHFQRVLRLIIEKTHPGVLLHLASDAVVGMAMCGALRPDVIIVDLLLPGVDGAALIASLRSQPHFEGMQVLVVTGLDAADREPYEYALTGITVIEKADVAQRLPSALGALLQR
jgi:excisionase family DNA binding protein